MLLQEDVELIELLDPSLLTFGSSPSGSSSRANTLPRPSLIARPSLWYVVRKEKPRDAQGMSKIIGSPENIMHSAVALKTIERSSHKGKHVNYINNVLEGNFSKILICIALV